MTMGGEEQQSLCSSLSICTAPTAIGHIEALSSPSVSAIMSRFPPLGLPPFLQLSLHHRPGARSCTAARRVERGGLGERRGGERQMY